MIDKIKKELLELKNKKVDLKVNNLRNKIPKFSIKKCKNRRKKEGF